MAINLKNTVKFCMILAWFGGETFICIEQQLSLWSGFKSQIYTWVKSKNTFWKISHEPYVSLKSILIMLKVETLEKTKITWIHIRRSLDRVKKWSLSPQTVIH